MDSELFDLGWDFYAAGIWLRDSDPKPVRQGWNAAKARHIRRQKPIKYWSQKWANLKLQATQRGIYFDDRVNPTMLQDCFDGMEICPITCKPMTMGTGTESDLSIDRVVNTQGYLLYNITAISREANKAKDRMSLNDVYLLVRDMADSAGGPEEVDLDMESEGLTYESWLRLLWAMSMIWPWNGWPHPTVGNYTDFSIRCIVAGQYMQKGTIAGYAAMYPMFKNRATCFSRYRKLIRKLQSKITPETSQTTVFKLCMRKSMARHWQAVYDHIYPVDFDRAIKRRNKTFGWRKEGKYA